MTPREQVEAHFTAFRPAGVVVAMTELDLRHGRVAFTAAVPPAAGRNPDRRVGVLETATGELTVTGASYGPQWSPDGSRLAWIVAQDNGFAVAVSAGATPVAARVRSVGGLVEAVRWSPDGGRQLRHAWTQR